MVSVSVTDDEQKSPIVMEENHGRHFTSDRHSSLFSVDQHGYDDNGGVGTI